MYTYFQWEIETSKTLSISLLMWNCNTSRSYFVLPFHTAINLIVNYVIWSVHVKAFESRAVFYVCILIFRKPSIRIMINLLNSVKENCSTPHYCWWTEFGLIMMLIRNVSIGNGDRHRIDTQQVKWLRVHSSISFYWNMYWSYFMMLKVNSPELKIYLPRGIMQFESQIMAVKVIVIPSW